MNEFREMIAPFVFDLIWIIGSAIFWVWICKDTIKAKHQVNGNVLAAAIVFGVLAFIVSAIGRFVIKSYPGALPSKIMDVSTLVFVGLLICTQATLPCPRFIKKQNVFDDVIFFILLGLPFATNLAGILVRVFSLF